MRFLQNFLTRGIYKLVHSFNIMQLYTRYFRNIEEYKKKIELGKAQLNFL